MDKQIKFQENTIVCGDCFDVVTQMPDECIDLTVASPPYDNLRDYEGYTFDFGPIAAELFRVTKLGGVVVWVVGDATVNGSETGTSFRQALGFMELGFRLHDTMIFHKDIPPNPAWRYEQHFDYMFVFSKGKPKTFNPIMVKTKREGWANSSGTFRKNGQQLERTNRSQPIGALKKKANIWHYAVGLRATSNSIAFGHPAIFPEALAHDHILSWSDKGDLVFDPFMGSGTTAVAADRLGRRWFGCDISEEYVAMALERLKRDRQRRSQLEMTL